MQQGNNDEFQQLEGIYENHYDIVAKEQILTTGEDLDPYLDKVSKLQGSLLARALSKESREKNQASPVRITDSLANTARTPFNLPKENRGLMTQAVNQRARQHINQSVN